MTASSTTFVAVLRAAGFRLIHRDEASAVLRRGTRVVIVPALEELPAETFERLALEAGITPVGFEALEELWNETKEQLPPSSRRPLGISA